MTATTKHSAQATPSSAPVVLFGMDSRGRPKGARFAKEFVGLATKAASQLQLQILPGTDPKIADIVRQLPVGRIHNNGRTFVPFIRREVYDKLVAAAPNGSHAHQPSSPGGGSGHGAGAGAPGSSSPNLPRNWQEIGVGDLVVAQEGLEDGWYEAIVMDISDDTMTLRWRDYPKERRVVRHRRRLALLHFEGEKVSRPAKPTASSRHAVSEQPGADQHALPKTWAEIGVNSLVLARDEGPFQAWWEAIAVEVKGDVIKLRWRDHNLPPFTRPRLDLALICPDAG